MIRKGLATPRARATFIPGLLVLTLTAIPSATQAQVTVRGRVEDAVSRLPVSGARVIAPDSAAVFTDSLGAFAIDLDAERPFQLGVQQYGYVPQTFELIDEAPTKLSVLLLEPAPIELAAINVVSESAIEEQFTRLRRRRRAYRGSVTAFDKAQLEQQWPVGSAWDVVSSRVPGVFECAPFGSLFVFKSGICVRGRGPTPSNPYPQTPVRVCVDGWESWSAISELASLDIRQVSLIEVYGRGTGGVRVYTAGYLAVSARSGRNIAPPLQFGGC